MTAHMKVHDDAATLDPRVVAGLLRRTLGFDGAVVADALEMRGVSARHDVADAAVLALEAGVDAVIVGHDLGEPEVDRIVAALERRVVPERLAQAAARVDGLATLATPRSAAVDRAAALAAAARAVRVDGDISLPAHPRVVELRPRANIAAGEAAHGIAAVVVREGERVPGADVYLVRDAHRHPWMHAADRPGAVVVETGLPVWRPRHAAAYVTTLGGGRAALGAALALLAPGVAA
jgi:beta-N-acetylhexosaminidase